MEANVSKYTNAIGSGKQAITQGQKRKGGRGMREGWEYKKLGDCFPSIKNGANIKQIKGADGLPITRIETLSGGVFNRDRMGYAGIYNLDKYSDYVLEDGDLLLSHINSKTYIGRTVEYRAKNDETIIHGMNLLRLKSNSDVINSSFFAYYTLSNDFKTNVAKVRKDAVNQSSIAISDIRKFSIPVPPIQSQQYVVDELDKINELIRLKKEQLKDYDNLAQSIFYEMFGEPVVNEKGWDFKKIGEIGTVERGAGISKKDFVEDGLPCIHYGQLHTILGPTTRHHHSCIPESLLPKYKIAHTNDVIMAITSEDVEGSCKSTAWLGNYDIVIGSDAAILHHEQDGTFLSYYTMTKAFFNEKSKYAKGFKVTHISAKEIENIPVYLPPLALQKDFAKRIEVIEHQKENIKSTIQDLETLLASRMQYWFD